MKKNRTGKRTKVKRPKDSKLHKYELYGEKNKHHNRAQEFGGRNDRANIYHWDINVHHSFHLIFGNRTLLEAASLLIYIDSMKQQGVEIDALGVEE